MWTEERREKVQGLSLEVPQYLEVRKRKRIEKIKLSRNSKEKENQESRVSPKSPRRCISREDWLSAAELLR